MGKRGDGISKPIEVRPRTSNEGLGSASQAMDVRPRTPDEGLGSAFQAIDVQPRKPDEGLGNAFQAMDVRLRTPDEGIRSTRPHSRPDPRPFGAPSIDTFLLPPDKESTGKQLLC